MGVRRETGSFSRCGLGCLLAWGGAGLAVWGGVRSIYDFDGKTAGKRAQVLIFSPFLASCSSLSLFGCPRVLLLALYVRSGRASWRHRGGGRRVRLAGALGVSCSPTAWGRAGRSRAVSVVRLPCWPCWGSLCGRWGWCWAWAAISGQPAR